MSFIAAAGVFEKRMKEVPGLFDVNSDLQIASPEVKVDIDRDRASAMGVTADKIENALYDAYRRAAGVRYLHAHQRLSGSDGAAAALPAGSCGAALAVRSIGRGQTGAAGRA